jgi:hypothetical protein
MKLLLLCFSLPLFATTKIEFIESTQSQAKVLFTTSSGTTPCSVRASRGTTLGTQIPDLADNGATEPRTGWIVNGSQHTIILGSHKGNDALAANGTYIVGVTCSPDAEVTQVFQTKPIQWGNTAPDIVPFNAAKFGNMDHPTIDWNGAGTSWGDPRSHSYVDPNTGVEYWVVSHPGSISAGIQIAQYAGVWYGTSIDVTGAKWATPANVGSNGSTMSVGSGGPSDPIFIPLTNFANPGGGGSFAGFSGNSVLDDLIFDVYCGNGAATGITLTLQLGHYNGASQPVGIGTPITTAACPTTAPVKVGSYPNAGDPTKVVAQPMFKGWGLNGIQRNRVMPPAGTVNVAGSVVTLTGSPTWQNYFNLDWAIGQPIFINGSYAHLAAAPSSSTALTIQENLGTLTSVAYTGVDLGLLITKSNNGSNVSVSVGLNYAGSPPPSACCNGDIGMINLAPVSVSKSADGTTCGIYTVGCSAGTLSPALQGYIGVVMSNSTVPSVILWIPRNADGSARAETRLLSTLSKPAGSARTNGNGDNISGSSLGLSNSMFLDNQNGNAVYGQDQNNKRIWKLIYNESYTGCAGYVTFHPYPASGDYNTGLAAIMDDCFTWTVVTPLAGGHDVRTQVMGTAGNNGGYQTGLNYLGQTVGQAHTGFDLGWMTNTGTSIGADAGYITISFSEFQNGLGVVASFADDGSGAYVLKNVHDTWSEHGLRWGGDHAIPLTDMGTFRFGAVDPLDDTNNGGFVFNGRNRATVSQVNRAGFGSAAVWDSNTAVTSNTDFYTCPSVPAPYAVLSGTLNCLQVRVNTPFCQISPNTTYVFPDGKTEKNEFPCTTPGFGIANASYSKLQDIQTGDWLFSDLGIGVERFAIVTSPVYNSATDITFWVLRTMGFLWNSPTFGAGDETGGGGHAAAGQFCCTHSNGWYLWAAPSTATASVALDLSSPTNGWLTDNPFRFSGHGSAGRGTSAGLYSFAQGGSACPAHSYCGGANLTPTQHITSNLLNLATQAPSFAGISGAPIDAMLQSYSSATQDAAVSPYPFFVDFRHINPSSGFISTEAYNPFGNAFTMTPVAGTTKTYLVSLDCCVPSPDYKRWGLQGYAGRYWMKDVSSPTTFSSAADMADWSVCLARNSNECVLGSSAGQRYVTLPKHDIQSQCSSSAFGLAVPCVSAFGPWTGQTVQYRIDKYEPTGLMSRKFGFAHAHLGLHYPFSNCRPTPDGQFMFCPGYWLDGVRTEWIALRIGALPPVDNVNRATFVPISVNYQGVPSASNIRARFGYAENGGDLLRCTPYGQDCSTEIPSGSPGDPFSFTNEVATRQACVSGTNCTVTIPSLANRILYYVVDWLNSSGGVVQTGPMQAIAVP